MRFFLIFILLFFSSFLYSEGDFRSILFKEGKMNIPSEWRAINKSDCLYVSGRDVDDSSYLKLCQYASSEKSNYFFMNDDGEWEAVTDGVPVLANINAGGIFTGMSAIVSCRYNDDAGFHAGQCFQAEIDSSKDMIFIFTGKGDASLFDIYKKIYNSFRLSSSE